MIKYNGMKIRTQVLILAACSLFIVVFSQVYSYVRFSILTEQRAYSFFSQTTESVQHQIESELDTVRNLAWQISSNFIIEKYLLNDDYWLKYNMGMLVDDYLSGVRTSNRLVSCIYMNSFIDDRIKVNPQDSFDKYRDTIAKYMDKNQKQAFFTDVSYDKLTGKRFIALVQPVTPAINLSYFNKNIAMLYVFCDIGMLSDLMPKTSEGSDSFFILLDEDMNILSSNKGNEAQKIMETEELLILEGTPGTGRIILDGKKYLYHLASLNQVKWKILVISSLSELTKDMKPISNMGIIIGIITLFVFLIFTYIIIRSVNDPIRNMIHEMKSIGNMDFHKRLSVKNKNEIGLMANNINLFLEEIEMRTRRIFKTQEELYNAEIVKKQAQLSSLQSQINPHFLYNTLECMRSISDYYRIDEVSLICGSMANIFRYCTTLKQYVTIKEEIECINEYFNIIRVRFSDKYSMEININPEILTLEIVKMTLQPLVENAVYHGLEKKRGQGRITINGDYSPDGNIVINISDDGTGVPEEDMEKLQLQINDSCDTNDGHELNGIGLINIHRRIRLIYGEPFGLMISSEPGSNFTVTLTIPNK